jgi:hypothetical protein
MRDDPMDTPSEAESTLSRVDDGRGVFDAPIRDALLRLGYLSQEQTARVVSHQN